MTTVKTLKQLKEVLAYDGFKMKAHVLIKGKAYKIAVSPDIQCRGGWNGKGTSVNIWRAYGEINENGVQPGVRGYQGCLSLSKIIEIVSDWV